MVRSDIAKALEQKHPRAPAEPERPQRPRRRVVRIPTRPGSVPDLYVEGDAVPRSQPGPVAPEERSLLRGYEENGEGFSADLAD
jgi:hypothetical protein